MWERGTTREVHRSWRATGQLRITHWRSLVLRVIGAGLLVATGAIHLDLYLTGYRTIPTIGWLFLLQIITAFGLGLIVLPLRRAGWPRLRVPGSPSPPWAATCCRCGSGSSGSVRSAPLQGSWPGSLRWRPSLHWLRPPSARIGPRRVAAPATVGTERPHEYKLPFRSRGG